MKHTRYYFLLLILQTFSWAPQGHAKTLTQPWTSEQWRELHRLVPNFGSSSWKGELFKGEVPAYFSQQGHVSPKTEWVAWTQIDGCLRELDILNKVSAYRSSLIKCLSDHNYNISIEQICAHWVRYETYLHLESRITPDDLEDRLCPRLSHFLSVTSNQAVELVFAGPLIDQPASAFGHIMLKFNHKNLTDDGGVSRGGDVTSSVFSFSVAQMRGLLHALSLLFSTGEGQFQFTAWEETKITYTHDEQRVIWTYPLNLKPQEQRELLLHVWSLSHLNGLYQFHSSNCVTMVAWILGLSLNDPHLISGLGWPIAPQALMSRLSSSGRLKYPEIFPPSRWVYGSLVESSKDPNLDPAHRSLLQAEARLRLHDEKGRVHPQERLSSLRQRARLSSDQEDAPPVINTFVKQPLPHRASGLIRMKLGLSLGGSRKGVWDIRWRGQDEGDASDGVSLPDQAWSILRMRGKGDFHSSTPRLILDDLELFKIDQLPRFREGIQPLSWRLRASIAPSFTSDFLIGFTLGKSSDVVIETEKNRTSTEGQVQFKGAPTYPTQWAPSLSETDWTMSFMMGGEVLNSNQSSFSFSKVWHRGAMTASVLNRVSAQVGVLRLYNETQAKISLVPALPAQRGVVSSIIRLWFCCRMNISGSQRQLDPEIKSHWATFLSGRIGGGFTSLDQRYFPHFKELILGLSYQD